MDKPSPSSILFLGIGLAIFFILGPFAWLAYMVLALFVSYQFVDKPQEQREIRELNKLLQEIKSFEEFKIYRNKIYYNSKIKKLEIPQKIADWNRAFLLDEKKVAQQRAALFKEEQRLKLQNEQESAKRHREESLKQLQKNALAGMEPPATYTYDSYISSEWWATKRAKTLKHTAGACEFCSKTATEVHHRKYPKPFGIETIEHLIAVCSHCHKLCHGLLAGQLIKREICPFCDSPASVETEVMLLQPDSQFERIMTCSRCNHIFHGNRMAAYGWSHEKYTAWRDDWSRPD